MQQLCGKIFYLIASTRDQVLKLILLAERDISPLMQMIEEYQMK